MMKTDGQLQHDVMAELEWEPSVDHAEIGVTVTDGVVTLSGFVRSYAERLAAERAARRVAGVHAIAEEIKVRFPSDPRSSDTEIARRILEVFRWNVHVPDDKISVKVEHGFVTLAGAVDWYFQSEAAQFAAGRIEGVAGINNQITVNRLPIARDIRESILAAFKRSADLDAAAVTVSTEGHTVRLGGRVKAWNERKIAERVAWSAPGVTKVEDDIVIAA